MVLRLKLINDYKNYNLLVNNEVNKEKFTTVEESEQEKSDVIYRGLENETDLLTKGAQQYSFVSKLGKFSLEDKELADETNAILASLGCNYKVSAAQVASVANGLNNVVLPGMKLAEEAAIEANIKDPNGPFAELFA